MSGVQAYWNTGRTQMMSICPLGFNAFTSLNVQAPGTAHTVSLTGLEPGLGHNPLIAEAIGNYWNTGRTQMMDGLSFCPVRINASAG